jgi:hypothetical protein
MPMALHVAVVITANATARVGLWIEVEDDGAAAEVGEADGVPVLVGKLEIRGRVALLAHGVEQYKHSIT